MDASELSAMRLEGRRQRIQSVLSEYFEEHLARHDGVALAEGVRAVIDLDPSQAPRIWNQLRSLPGFIPACGPGLVWKIHRLEPGLRAWDRSAWNSVPAWIPSREEDTPLPAAAVEVIRAEATGTTEQVDFEFRFRCPWCEREHVFFVRRTLVYRRIYSCPDCDGHLLADGRNLRDHIQPCNDPDAVLLYEDRMHRLWHDLHRARGEHPPEAQLLCQAFTTHLTRAASAALSLQGR